LTHIEIARRDLVMVGQVPVFVSAARETGNCAIVKVFAQAIAVKQVLANC